MKSIKVSVVERIKRTAQPAQAFRVRVTPEMAQDFLKTMARNRPLVVGRVAAYQDRLRRGEWSYTGQGIVFANGKMIDGQHRCWAIVNEGKAAECLVVLDAPPDAWNKQDMGKPRGAADMLGIKYRFETAGALTLLSREVRGFEPTNGQMFLATYEAPAFLEQHQGLTDAVVFACKHRAIRMSAALLSYCVYRARLANGPKADVFFESLASGEGLTRNSPVYLLRERLIANAHSKTKLPKKEVLALVIRAWTLYLQGKSAATLRWRSNGPTKEPFPEWPGPSIAITRDAAAE